MEEHRHSLYQQVILEHNRSPQNFWVMNDCTHRSEGLNPICGDHIWVYLDANDNKIHRLSFTGEGCAICKASASIMTCHLQGKSITAAKSAAKDFHALAQGNVSDSDDRKRFGKLIVFATIHRYPARVKCATLAWHTLLGALSNAGTVSTENTE
ncbi:MAG: SUF system NifU family Fe-S cluster assembly protein [Pseudomonadota bacterium]|nr:SUF system NifU family Fe-S cluster assembly protein [Pseudomonadota bacterium]